MFRESSTGKSVFGCLGGEDLDPSLQEEIEAGTKLITEGQAKLGVRPTCKESRSSLQQLCIECVECVECLVIFLHRAHSLVWILLA